MFSEKNDSQVHLPEEVAGRSQDDPVGQEAGAVFGDQGDVRHGPGLPHAGQVGRQVGAVLVPFEAELLARARLLHRDVVTR